MKFFLIAMIAFNTFSLSAETIKTHMLVLGGSGEPAGKQTLFDSSFSQVGDYYQTKVKRGEMGQTSIAFDGGHSDTDAIKNSKFPNAEKKQDFTKENLKQEISRFKKMMSEGKEIKKGDQLLIYINSHGAAKGTEKTHSISIGSKTAKNLDSLLGAELFNLDQLEELKKMAKDKGIKLGIVDLSCHAGNTQNLADENTCVVSATGRNHYSFTTGFSGNFSKNIQPGESLESAFLKTRKSGLAADFPVISTPEGQLIEKQLYELLSPYLNYRLSATADKLTPSLLKAASDPVFLCEKNNDFKDLNRFLEDIDKITENSTKKFLFSSKESLVNFEDLKKTLREYKKVQDKLTVQLKSMNADKLNTKVQINEKNSYTWAELLSTDWSKWGNLTESALKSKGLSATDRKLYENNLVVYKKSQEEKTKILRNHPGLANYKDIVKNYDEGRKLSERWAEKIAEQEKKLFDGLYKHYAKEMTKTNVCREFKL